MARRSTATSAFGVSRRESHDATGFYRRFPAPELSADAGGGAGPATYMEYLQLLRDVFGECARKLEPGGRIAVNVANLGRRPYRSLSADVIGILQDDLGLLLRGEAIWQKGEG